MSGIARKCLSSACALLRPLGSERPFRAYCVSLGKSGTHSVVDLFSSHYRARHEPGVKQLIRCLLAYESGAISYADRRDFFARRDDRRRIVLEASTVLVHFVDVIRELYPSARFILTLRDCYSWLNSAINHALYRGIRREWRSYNEFLYGPGRYDYSREESLFAEHGLYSLDSHLSVWARHNAMALSSIPGERLLVIRLKDLAGSAKRLSEFLDVPEKAISTDRSHRFRAVGDAGLLYRLDRSFLEDRVRVHCQALMEAHFPGIRGLEDAVPGE